MFEDYLEDAFHFFNDGSDSPVEKEKERYFRVATFCVASALEAFINYLGDGFENTKSIAVYELALLQDRKFSLINGEFSLTNQSDFRRIEDKLRFLLKRFSPKFDIATSPSWSDFLAFKSLRDDITHPRDNKDVSLKRLGSELPRGMNAVIDLMGVLILGIYGNPLRQKIIDLKIK